MPEPDRYKIRLRVLVLWLCTAIPLFVLALASGRQTRRLLVRDAMSHVRLIARLTTEQHRGVARETRQMLFALANTDAVLRQDADAIERACRGIVEGDARYVNIGALNAAGEVFASGLPVSTHSDGAHRAFYQRVMASRKFAVGEFYIEESTHRPVLAFAMPVVTRNLQLACILFAALDIDYIGSAVVPGLLPEGTSVTACDASGTVLMRHPDPDTWIGKEVGDTLFFQAAQRSAEAGFAEEVGLDGVRRLYAYSSLVGASDGEDVFLALGIPVDAVTREASDHEWFNLALLLVLTAVGGGAAWLAGDRLIVRVFGEVHKLAQRDPLTQSYNRRYLMELGRSELTRALRTNQPYAVVLLDIDHFKRVNDSLGHHAGDEVLREVARRLQGALRAVDTLTRYGGEEFCAVLPAATLVTAMLVAERLRMSLLAAPIRTSYGTLSITLSAGVATIDGNPASFEAMLNDADQAMYRAKREGRNRVCTIDSGDPAQ